jgi:hypothetical protein
MIDEEQTQNKEHHTENEHEQTIEDLLDMIS